MNEPPRCPEHGRLGTATCLTCGREACPECLGGRDPAHFACPACGQTGAALYDEDPQIAPEDEV